MRTQFGTCSLTFEQACSFLRCASSFWYAPLHSLSHKHSNDMLDYMFFFTFGCDSSKSISAQVPQMKRGNCLRARFKFATAQASNFRSAMLTHVRNAQQCATCDFDAVFCSKFQIRPAILYKFRIFLCLLKVTQY